jgi:hypothetical protein
VLPLGQPSSDERLVAAWALVTHGRLAQMHAGEVQRLAAQGSRFDAMPRSWERAVEQRLRELGQP